jgi:hypothetical protein
MLLVSKPRTLLKDGFLPEIDLSLLDDPNNHDAGYHWVLEGGSLADGTYTGYGLLKDFKAMTPSG